MDPTAIVNDLLSRADRAGLTRGRLADLAGVDPDTLRRWSRGENTPHLKKLNQVEAAVLRAEEAHRVLTAAPEVAAE